MDLNPHTRDARELAWVWDSRLIPGVMIGSYLGAGIGTLPFELALYFHFAPLFFWVYWRLILWKNWPETRLNTIAVPLTAMMVVVAIAFQKA